MGKILSSIKWHDVLDILIVAAIFYRFFLVIKGTRALQMLTGLVIMFFAWKLSERLGLNTLNWIFQNFWAIWVLIIIILFQPELRRLLAHVGQQNFIEAFYKTEKSLAIDIIVRSAISLANKKIGALIVIERESNLNNYIEAGIEIDAILSRELLTNIFMPKSPLHDGAVIIKNGRIAIASCFLPLSLNPNISNSLGTRHRAALGLTEETDAVTIVVSEETGTISLALLGKLTKDLDSITLRKVLQKTLELKKGSGIKQS
ncbi:MAG: diadenylate cyclase CdaA [bacterium]